MNLPEYVPAPPFAPPPDEPLLARDEYARLKIAIVTDAWKPQVNGVVRTLDQTGKHLERMGHRVQFVTSEGCRTLPCPTYPSIRIALVPGRRIAKLLDRFDPDAVHIATEGPIGHAARRYCLHHALPFTTSFHTQFPEYVRARAPIPMPWTYAYLRRFHQPAVRTLVATPSLMARLRLWGFTNLHRWSRGVDTSIFKPGPKEYLLGPRPRMLFVGRVAVEKNIEAFLSLHLPGSKYVIGDGPDRERLQQQYPEVQFIGEKLGVDLAAHVASADVFVFPSLTDTFGLVMLEAMACGVPVAAYPAIGPVDVVQDGVTGVLDKDLGAAVTGALQLDSNACVAYARTQSWAHCTRVFLSYMAPRERFAGQIAASKTR